MRRAFWILSLILAACSHTDESVSESDNSFKSVAPIGGGGAFGGVLGGVTIVYDLANRHGTARKSELAGECRLLSKNPEAKDGPPREEPCKETFLEIENLKSGQKSVTWFDENGRFQMPIVSGVPLKVTAVSDHYGVRSKTLEVSKPGKISLTIDVRARRSLD